MPENRTSRGTEVEVEAEVMGLMVEAVSWATARGPPVSKARIEVNTIALGFMGTSPDEWRMISQAWGKATPRKMAAILLLRSVLMQEETVDRQAIRASRSSWLGEYSLRVYYGVR
jgi:hypothetical protein